MFYYKCILNSLLLTSAEIKVALVKQGGEDVTIVAVKGRLDTIKEFVVASGRTSRHLRKMAESIVQAVSKLIFVCVEYIIFIY